MKVKKKVIGIIPARFGSSRLPGKPLVDIGGKPMIQWVVERVSCASLISRVLVATDDKRIFNKVREFGAETLMTPVDIPSGTDRAAFVAGDLDAEIIINIQGDEPFIEPDEVDLVADILLKDEEAEVGTLVKRISSVEELESPNTAKVVVNSQGYALYFSRSPIPFYRDSTKHTDWIKKHTYYKHVGIYSFRKDFLLQYAQWEPVPIERAEKLEQLRVLEKGYRIKVAETEYEPVCIDTPEDVERVRLLLHRGVIPNMQEN